MRINRLDLIAFGPFTDRSLEFSTIVPGLHIVYGANEAGKSSSLRALNALLYGFPQQTPDNFLHSYDQLLVGGALENSDGGNLVFQRRKKRLGDILDEHGNPLEPAVLASFLHGVEPEVFSSLYGIDHDKLVRGGEEILAQKGEVGQALFAAGAGISSLREVINQLETEAGELFKPTGQLPSINRALKDFRELQKNAREASLSVKAWKDQKSALERAQAERQALEAERDAKSREVYRLERLAQAIPELAALQLRHAQLNSLGRVVLLEPGFAELYQQLNQEMRETELQLQRDRARLAGQKDKRTAISFNTEILAHAERIDDFHQRLGEYRKGQKDRPERNGIRISLRTEAAALLWQMRPDLDLGQLETLRPLLARKRTIQTLISQFAVLEQRRQQATRQGRIAKEESERTISALHALPAERDTHGLVRAVKMAQKAGDIDLQVQTAEREAHQGKRECQTALDNLGLWSGEVMGLLDLPLPLLATTQRFGRELSELTEARRALATERSKNEKELLGVLADLKKLEAVGDVPSERELVETRKKRDNGWHLIRRNWLDGVDLGELGEGFEGIKHLARDYEDNVGRSDGLADRLRREADRVAGAMALRSQQDMVQQVLAENDRQSQGLDARQRRFEDEWHRLWSTFSITPLSPQEMDVWLTEVEKLRLRLGEILRKEDDLRRGVTKRAELRQVLTDALLTLDTMMVSEGDELGPLLASAETLLERIAKQQTEAEKTRERQRTAVRNLQQAEDDLKSTAEALAEWQRKWDEAVRGLGVSRGMAVFEAGDRLEMLQNCFEKVKEAEVLQKRINGIDRDAAAFDSDVKGLLDTLALRQVHHELDHAVLLLRSTLNKAQKESALCIALDNEIDELKGEIAAAEMKLETAKLQMAGLMEKAECDSPASLTKVIDTFKRYQNLREKIAESEANIARIGAGLALAELSEQAEGVVAEELSERIGALKKDVSERLNPQINTISQQIGELSAGLMAMDGGDGAGRIADEMEEQLARMRRLAHRYAVVRVAARVLQQEIERYRREHQDPVLKIGSRYFRDLTIGSFEGLRTDIDDKGTPILIGVRAGGLRLSVNMMSSGTRDQLFLALRMATLEWRLESSEAVPFIVDDILINFDDDRSQATLVALAMLARRNQVILFTHHRQIVEMARNLDTEGEVQIHEL